MNLVRSSIVPHTIASDTAQKTNSKNHLAAAGAVLAAMAGRLSCDPGLKVGKKPLPPITAKMPPAPNANPNPTAQYAMELTLRLVMTLATTVPTFFMRLKPTSSIAKPACMKRTKQPATITQTVSAATAAAEVAVVSSARAVTGARAASAAPRPDKRSKRRRRNSAFMSSTSTGKDVTSGLMRPAYGRPAAGKNVWHKRIGRSEPRTDRTRKPGLWTGPFCNKRTEKPSAGSGGSYLISGQPLPYDAPGARIKILVFRGGCSWQ